MTIVFLVMSPIKYFESLKMKKNSSVSTIGALVSAALLFPATSYAGCNAGSFFTGGCNDNITKVVYQVINGTSTAMNTAGAFANDAAAQAYGFANATEANALAKTTGFVSSSAAITAGFADKVQLQAMHDAAKAAGFANAQAAYARGYVSTVQVSAMQTYAKSAGWTSLAVADAFAISNGFANVVAIQAKGYTSLAQVQLFSAASKAARYSSMAAAEAEAEALGFSSYGARIVNDSKDLTQAEFNSISSTLQTTYNSGLHAAYTVYGYALTAVDYLKDPSNVLSLLQKACSKNATDTFKSMGGPSQTIAQNLIKINNVPTTPSQKAPPQLILGAVPPVPTLTPQIQATLDKQHRKHSSVSAFFSGGQNSFNKEELAAADAYVIALHNHAEALTANENAKRNFAADAIAYAPITTGTDAQKALVRLIRSIGRGSKVDKQMAGDLVQVAQAAGLIDSNLKNLVSPSSPWKPAHIGMYVGIGATAENAGGNSTVSFGLDISPALGSNQMVYALTVGGGATLTTETAGQAGISTGVFWGSGSIRDSEGISLTAAFNQQIDQRAFLEEGLNWNLPTQIDNLIKHARDKNIIAMAKDELKQITDFVNMACSAPDISTAGGVGTKAELGASFNFQFGYQKIIKSGTL
ncbi:hypothetical protein [Duganella qianjiadongensis]|uniref:Autotransporter domain-containing protein n=1 Tax=Duganella qianjiadongensis TaxID=2692176 RepID=A0ABW9VRG0_9BURK|nr:hypothetical protein [Duganella qianjiadongensis]MYM42011.1 hypothetical protein [Duganella qianjiadongensis]